MQKMSKYKRKMRMQELNPEPQKFKVDRLIRLKVGPLWLQQKTVVCLQLHASPNFRKLLNRKQRPTPEKVKTRVKYFLLIHLRKISQLEVGVILAEVLLSEW